MLTSEFDYPLPPELIAQRPLTRRDTSRMMVVERATGGFEDRRFRDLPGLLRAGDLLVFNNTRVFPARLLGRRVGLTSQKIGKHNPTQREYLHAEIEVFLIRQEGEDRWKALVHPGRKVRPGERVIFGENELEAEILERGAYGVRLVRLRSMSAGESVEALIDRLGHVPLPPYIHRSDDPADRETYQTVYAKVRGAVAAPTAGLHFSDEVFKALAECGVESCEITLHVGLGTFQPIRTEEVEKHRMEPESYEISESAAEKIRHAQRDGRRIVAVGTTVVRTLEHAAAVGGGRVRAGSGETSLFIYPLHPVNPIDPKCRPEFRFQLTDALLTNFHLPCSTLLMLVSAFAGQDLTLRAYRHAVEERYRFYSYGDCMLIV